MSIEDGGNSLFKSFRIALPIRNVISMDIGDWDAVAGPLTAAIPDVTVYTDWSAPNWIICGRHRVGDADAETAVAQLLGVARA